jgi:arylsulfatase A
MSKILLILLTVLMACQSDANTTNNDNSKPNVIYILCDDMGFGDVTSFNPKGKIKTPHLDKLSKNGMRFTDAHSGSAVCTPTRYGIVTGRYSWRSRLKMGVLWGESDHLINPDRQTVADLFKSKGYHTAMIGKWHLGWDFGRNEKKQVDFTKPVKNGPDVLGFDYYYGHCGSLDMPPYVYVENGKITSLPDGTTVNGGKGFWRKGLTGKDFKHIDVTPNFVNRACKYIDERAAKKESFFLYLPLPSPHTPILPIDEFKGKSGTNEYGDFVQQIDWHIGQIMATLKKHGLTDNTLVIFTTDNGTSPRADFPFMNKLGHQPCGIYRGHKADIYEGGHRVPFIAHWPNKIPKGKVSDATLCHTDLMATCADILDIDLADNAAEDSFSFIPVIEGKKGLRPSVIHHSVNGTFAIKKGAWKLIFHGGSAGWSFPRHEKDLKGLPPIQLYNLYKDPGEKNNLQAKEPGKVKELTDLITKLVMDGRSTPGKNQTNEGEKIWAQLTWMKEKKK